MHLHTLASMKKSTLLLALAFTGLLSVPASAQIFAGSDDFNSGPSTKWDYDYRLGGATTGSLTFTNSRLDFTKPGGPGNQHFLWNSDGTPDASVSASSFATSWAMTLSVTNKVTDISVGSGEFASVGFEVFNDANSYSALMLNSNELGLSIRTEGTGFSTGSTFIANDTDVILRLMWDATAQTLGAAYSLDGSTFTSVATFLPMSQWNNGNPATSVDNGFNFGVFGNSNMLAGITLGSVYADNMSVSAIPEPSTYAALAGLGALGLAFWRRRSARTVAKA